MNAVNTEPHRGGKDGQGASNSSPLPNPASEAPENHISSLLNMDALPSNFQIGCTKIVVVNKPTDQEERITKSAHKSLSSAIPKLASLKQLTNPDSNNSTPGNEFVLRGEQQQSTDTNRKLDLVLDKLTQMEGRMVLIEKQMYLLEKKNDTQQKGETDSADSSLSMFSPVSCLVDLENLEESAKDKKYVNFVKTHIQGTLRTTRGEPTTDQQSILASRRAGRTYCLRIIDLFFTRFFLTQCTWTGTVQNEVKRKICFKDFVNVFEMFYETVHYVEPAYTREDTESFLKQTLKNSIRRFQNPSKQKPSSRLRITPKPNHKQISTNIEAIVSFESHESMEFDPLEIKSEPDS